jgi:beta-1,2-mannobiose phosphorylase / 1,2-beta-oligomannan phosphorylase
MSKHSIIADRLIFTPDDVDLTHSPLRQGSLDHGGVTETTFVLGAFNPGLTRLPNGNLLLMVRIAEALSSPIQDQMIHCIRWDEKKKYTTEGWPLSEVEIQDPRKFRIKAYGFPVYALTSLSWLLPVELNEDGSLVRHIHYDKAIAPQTAAQEYGIEDPRISRIDGKYYMTVCCVSAARHSTMLYSSENGLDYRSLGIVLDHQNKDMLLFEGKIDGSYYALTRPMGECYFATAPSSMWHPGAAIHLASSPDLLHWRPADRPFLRARKSTLSNVKIGGGTPPILTRDGWLMLYHGVEDRGEVGVYRTFWALLAAEDPLHILALGDREPLLEANPGLTDPIKHQLYLTDVVFTTGIAEHGDHFILASGESDLACRITVIPRSFLSSTKSSSTNSSSTTPLWQN